MFAENRISFPENNSFDRIFEVHGYSSPGIRKDLSSASFDIWIKLLFKLPLTVQWKTGKRKISSFRSRGGESHLPPTLSWIEVISKISFFWSQTLIFSRRCKWSEHLPFSYRLLPTLKYSSLKNPQTPSPVADGESSPTSSRKRGSLYLRSAFPILPFSNARWRHPFHSQKVHSQKVLG